MKRHSKVFLVLAVLVVANIAIWAPMLQAQRGNWADQMELLVRLRYAILSDYVTEPDQEKLIQAAARGMVEALDDPYTAYLSPKDLESFDRQVRGSFSGIGAEITIDQDLDRLKIVTPLEDSPAWNAGVLAGDIVLEIDGESTAGINIMEAVDRLTGPEGTQVTVKVRHPSGEEKVITITRAQIKIQTVKGIRRDADHHWDYMIDPERKIAYIRLTQFTERTPAELREALESLQGQGIEALILDVRFNPGGLLEAAVAISDMFLEEGKRIVSVKGRNVPEEVTRSTSGALMPDIPVVVLANEMSASASEIVTGALSDNERAKFIGTRTFGKGSVQQVRLLGEDLGALKITRAYYYIPSGRMIHRVDDQDDWGVDPGPGFYVSMAPEEVKQMLETRREGDVLRHETDNNGPAQLTPQVIEEQLHDKQLAAALRAMQGKLETGQWPQVGEEGADALAMLARRENLRQQREFLQARLSEIEDELTELDDPTAQAEEEAIEPEEAPAELEPQPVDPEMAPAEEMEEELVPTP